MAGVNEGASVVTATMSRQGQHGSRKPADFDLSQQRWLRDMEREANQLKHIQSVSREYRGFQLLAGPPGNGRVLPAENLVRVSQAKSPMVVSVAPAVSTAKPAVESSAAITKHTVEAQLPTPQVGMSSVRAVANMGSTSTAVSPAHSTPHSGYTGRYQPAPVYLGQEKSDVSQAVNLRVRDYVGVSGSVQSLIGRLQNGLRELGLSLGRLKFNGRMVFGEHASARQVEASSVSRGSGK